MNIIIIAHLVGDYLLQNDYLAANKKSNCFICALHCLIYTCVMWAFTFWPWWALVLVFAQHFLQDKTKIVNWYMDAMGQKGFAKPPMAPWSVIMVDNTFHLLFLYGIMNWVNFFG